jgi:hypothetical protein
LLPASQTKRKKVMKISEVKESLSKMDAINFKLPDGSYVPSHFHLTEVGLVNKHFIDCGGVERKETIASFQLWQADDFDHRLAPQKFLKILDISKKILGSEDLDIEVEYQQQTIAKFALDFDGKDFLLTPKHTACLALDRCGIPVKKEEACCSSAAGCC